MIEFKQSPQYPLPIYGKDNPEVFANGMPEESA
jgi:hypothetical protein